MHDLRSAESIKRDWAGFIPHARYVAIAAGHSPLSTFQKVIALSGSASTAEKYQQLAELRIQRGKDLFDEITSTANA